MKTINMTIFLLVLLFTSGCQPSPKGLSEAEKAGIVAEVQAAFGQLLLSVEKNDAVSWSNYYSQEGFLSAFVSTDFYANRAAFIDTIAHYFSQRESQLVKPLDVQVSPLAVDLALMTSREETEMLLKNGLSVQAKHVFTMLWQKEKEGWRILHSHESWIDNPAK